MEYLSAMLLEEELKDCGVKIKALTTIYKQTLSHISEIEITEGVLDFDSDNLEYMFDEAKRRFVAANKGLALVNKLKDPTSKKENQKRIMSSMNKLRHFLKKLEKAVEAEYVKAWELSANKWAVAG